MIIIKALLVLGTILMIWGGIWLNTKTDDELDKLFIHRRY